MNEAKSKLIITIEIEGKAKQLKKTYENLLKLDLTVKDLLDPDEHVSFKSCTAFSAVKAKTSNCYNGEKTEPKATEINLIMFDNGL